MACQRDLAQGSASRCSLTLPLLCVSFFGDFLLVLVSSLWQVAFWMKIQVQQNYWQVQLDHQQGLKASYLLPLHGSLPCTLGPCSVLLWLFSSQISWELEVFLQRSQELVIDFLNRSLLLSPLGEMHWSHPGFPGTLQLVGSAGVQQGAFEVEVPLPSDWSNLRRKVANIAIGMCKIKYSFVVIAMCVPYCYYWILDPESNPEVTKAVIIFT